MSDRRITTICKQYRGHSYKLTLAYAQLFENGNLANEYLTRSHIVVDGRVISEQTPGYRPGNQNPEGAVISYIDYLEASKS